MAKPPGILKLPNDLLRDILDHIEADPEKSVNIDRRAYLSVESFRPPCPPPRAQLQDVGHFRLVCRRFSALGIPYQFTRVTTRFSRQGFQRLEKICGRPSLARHVKKFSYMVPYFYVEGRDQLRELFRESRGDLGALDANHFLRKCNDQKDIIRTKEDIRALNRAMAAFTALQHVQILRLQDEADRRLLEYLSDNREVATIRVDLQWTPACLRALRTVGRALLKGSSPFSRFSVPALSPPSVSEVALETVSIGMISSLAERLTCLELHFDDGVDLDHKMRELSPLFKVFFTSATAMQAVHVGFPSRQPLSLRLEEIFHEVRWDKLRAVGIQAWRLNADEIIALARRHRRTLRGLRLRDVLLKEGSHWKDVLGMLRNEMELLDWVSLRRIGYAKTFDELWAGSMEIRDDGPGSDSDDEDEFPAHLSEDDGGDEIEGEGFGHQAHFNHDVDQDETDSEDYDSEFSHDDDSEHGPEANELALSPDTPSSVPWCNCGRRPYPDSADDLGDNGITVDYLQRKLWEKWVVGRCPEHSP
ncbi:F-box domain-containing protein [Xylona heveae TC161]|uniref:F-box domain-containing protein n=1 Tax=Xylona heveae (strain CBS 132557 / TC161) TaxID=1328760 RepID=A0A165JG14_XYLHT|nr:F-box domain-containing protein [Xylona heveae TC161]KZF26187.1 F-box domain-containing protein [Xylona heveae TC161]